MKKFALLGALLSSVILLMPSTVFAASSQPIVNETNLATNSAQTWLNHAAATAATEIPQWQDAVVTKPQVFYNLDGAIDAYLFSINYGNDGYVLVGSSLYGYDMLQAGTKAPFAVLTPEIVAQTINSIVPLAPAAQISTNPTLIYTGVDGFFAVYEIEGQHIAINLVSHKTSRVSEIATTMPSPARYQALLLTDTVGSPNSILTTYYNTLNMSYWNGSGRGWCGPCSGVSIGAYYRDYLGYSNLPSSNAAMYDYLYDSMGTEQYGGVTMPDLYGPGFVDMAEYYGYSNIEQSLDWFVGGMGDYWAIADHIDSGWPTALEITTETHWRAISGYYAVVEQWEEYYDIVCTNSATSDSFEFLNWLDLDPNHSPEMNYTVSITES